MTTITNTAATTTSTEAATLIDAMHATYCAAPLSDINELLPTLCDYARQCDSVAEFGVRAVVSTWSLLKGLKDGVDAERQNAPVGDANPAVAMSAKPPPRRKTLLSVDLERSANYDVVPAIASAAGVSAMFVEADDLTVDLAATGGVDMLFIDTWHVYGQLIRELRKHAPHVRRYIAMHDTEVDGMFGESVRGAFDTHAQSARSGIPEHELRVGLKAAVFDFLAKPTPGQGSWVLHQHLPNCNGLTVLRRTATPDQS